MSQAEGCDESVDEIEDMAEPLGDFVDGETDCPEFPNDARNYSAIFGQRPKIAFAQFWFYFYIGRRWF